MIFAYRVPFIIGLLATAVFVGCSRPAVDSSGQIPIIVDLLPADLVSSERSGVVVDMLLIHFCSDALAHPECPYDYARIRKIFQDNHVAAHYLIDRNGIVFRLVEERRAAYHAGRGAIEWDLNRSDRLNHYSVGIELMGTGSRKDMLAILPRAIVDRIPEEMLGFTDDQYKALRVLVADILKRNPNIRNDRKHIIGHAEYAVGRRLDPGALFDWNRIGL
jgi:N-acetylmuramoyl-L-alanine amidase